jgi:uncharacterized membrane-anchored protein
MAAVPSRAWRYHPERDALLAEAHARPSTPLAAPMLATRIANVSGESGLDADRAHMATLCRRLGQPEPGPSSRWCVLDAGSWRLRWERHTEVSTWTFFRPPASDELFKESALDLVPADWAASFPGEVLAAVRLEVRPGVAAPPWPAVFGMEAIGAEVAEGAAKVVTDFRPDSAGLTRMLLIAETDDPALIGRLCQSLLEIETYRLLALLAFPIAGEAGARLGRIETEAAALADLLTRECEPEEDRRLLNKLTALAGETEALIARTSYRFGAATAYHDLVRERIQRLREQRIEALQTIGEFMQRRLDPALRTCLAVAERQRTAIDRIARMTQMMNTRVEVAAEATNAALLASMDRRADLQLRLQQTVESVSAAAIAYYAVGLLGYPLKALEKVAPAFDAALVTGLLAPVVLLVVWLSLRRWRERLAGEAAGSPRPA